MMMIRPSQKVSAPPVPPRPSKTVVAEALAKSRKLSPVRVLYATQPLSSSEFKENNVKPVVPVRVAPPPPVLKPRPAPQIVKSFSSAAVFSQNSEIPKVTRSISDCREENDLTKPRTIIFQSNVKSSKIEVNLVKKSSFKRVESTKNEKNKKENENFCSSAQIRLSKIDKKDNTIIQSKDKTMITVSSHDDANNNTSMERTIPRSDLTSENFVENRFSAEKPTPRTSLTPEKSCFDTGKAERASWSPKMVDEPILSPERSILNAEKALWGSERMDFERSWSPEKGNFSLETGYSSSETTAFNTERSMSGSEDFNVDKSKTILVIPDDTVDKKKVKFDDNTNHELLIQELENMRKEQERLSKRQRKPFKDIYDTDDESNTRISHSDWVEVANGEEVRLSSCQIFINEDEEDNNRSSCRKNMSLHGLPPLPKSLSGFNLLDNGHRDSRFRVPASPGPQTPSRASSSRGPTPPTPGSGSGHVVYPPHPRMNGTGQRKPTTLDTQLAILRREMYGLRQLDLTLLSQLYSLNEAIQDFRQMLQEQEDTAFSPHSPSPSPSSGDEIDEFYSPQTIRFKPTGPMRRTSNSSSATSSEYGTV